MHYDDELTCVSAQELSLSEIEDCDEESRTEESPAPACDQPKIFAEESCRDDDSNAEYHIRDLRAEVEPVAKPITEEIGSDLCRVERNPITLDYEIYVGQYGGYRKDILTENLNEREKVWFICNVCEGIMKEACVSKSSGEHFCSCCQNILDWYDKVKSSVPLRKMINTLKCSCPISKRGCEWLGTLENCENHLDTCGYVYVSCKLKCGAVLRRNELEKHEKDTCPQRVVKCDHCQKDFRSCEFNEHLNKCLKMKVPCDLCNTQITRKDMPQHLKHDCAMVQEKCQLGCGVKITRNELKIHEKDTCLQRKIACKHCYMSPKFCDYLSHYKKCPNVKVLCDLCGIKKYRRDMIEHLKDYCPENEIQCPFVKYKCITVMKRKDMDNHLEEKETKHLGLKLTAMEDLVSKQSEETTKLNEEIIKQSEKIIKQSEETTKQNEKITKQSEEITKQNEKITKQNEKITKQSEEITKQNEKITKQNEKITKQNEKITKQSEEITKQNEKITKQNENITKQSENITKQSEEIKKLKDENEEQNREIESEKRHIHPLYSISDVTTLSWEIGNVTELMRNGKGHFVSEQYKVAGCSCIFRICYNRELSIIFPETIRKYDKPFITKCHIAFSSNNIMNCGKIEVKPKDLTRGCERAPTTISQENVDKYSKPRYLGDTQRNLTLWIYLAMQ